MIFIIPAFDDRHTNFFYARLILGPQTQAIECIIYTYRVQYPGSGKLFSRFPVECKNWTV
jgi:hypothetical protein